MKEKNQRKLGEDKCPVHKIDKNKSVKDKTSVPNPKSNTTSKFQKEERKGLQVADSLMQRLI